MNICQLFCHWVFGWDYAILIFYDNKMPVKRAYKLGGKTYASPYLSETKTELLPGGKVFGQCYIHGWRPVTPRTFTLFEQVED